MLGTAAKRATDGREALRAVRIAGVLSMMVVVKALKVDKVIAVRWRAQEAYIYSGINLLLTLSPKKNSRGL